MRRSTDADPALTDRLRAGDPAGDGREPRAEGLLAMRRRVLAEADAGPVRRPVVGTLLRAAAVGAVSLALVWLVWQTPTAPPIPSTDAAPPDSAKASADTRQIHFATPGGTRVIWVLDPDFQMPPRS